MIQNFILNIKSIFNKKTFNFLEPLTIKEFELSETYCLNHLNCSTAHSHKGEICKSPNMKSVLTYPRNYIAFHSGAIIEKRCNIPVVYCRNCKHHHAILPNFAIVPYCQYSIFFILSVLYDKNVNKLTVESIIKKYNISKSTMYRWLEKYKYYYSIFQQLRNKYSMLFFTCLIDHYEEIIIDLFDICAQSMFQHNRNLNQHPPAHVSPPSSTK